MNDVQCEQRPYKIIKLQISLEISLISKLKQFKCIVLIKKKKSCYDVFARLILMENFIRINFGNGGQLLDYMIFSLSLAKFRSYIQMNQFILIIHDL